MAPVLPSSQFDLVTAKTHSSSPAERKHAALVLEELQIIESEGDSDVLLESRRREYVELCLIYRHYSVLRFSILTVFIALTGGLIAIFSRTGGSTLSSFQVTALQVGGSLTTILFWILEERLIILLTWYSSRAEALEHKLHYRIFSGIPPHNRRSLGSVATATRTFYCLILLFWAFSLIFR